MDPLQELWELLEDIPPIQNTRSPLVATPESTPMETEHPVTQQRRTIDTLRKQGIPAPDAHQEVYGKVNLSDSEAKRDLATTMGRVQDDGNKKAVRVDMDADFPSVLAQDNKIDVAINQTSVNDLRTSVDKQVPDLLQTPESGVQQQEEIDYNWDVAYLQKYGRA